MKIFKKKKISRLSLSELLTAAFEFSLTVLRPSLNGFSSLRDEVSWSPHGSKRVAYIYSWDDFSKKKSSLHFQET